MSFQTPVPSDVEATSIGDLVNDCREVVSVLGANVLDLTVRAANVPLARLPLDRLPFSFGAMPVEITEDLLVTVRGMDDFA